MKWIYIVLISMILLMWIIGTMMIEIMKSRPRAPDPAPAYKIMRAATLKMLIVLVILAGIDALLTQM